MAANSGQNMDSSIYVGSGPEGFLTNGFFGPVAGASVTKSEK